MVLNKFLQAIDKYPENLAVKTKIREYSYYEFVSLVSSIARKINFSNKPLTVWADDTVVPYASIFAIWSKRNFYVPLNPAFPIERNLEIISQTETPLLVANKNAEIPQEIREKIEILYISTEERSKEIALQFDNSSEDLAYILFTSGSTGKPKGVPISFGNLFAFVEEVLKIYDFRPEDRFLQMFKLTFDLSIFSYLIPLLTGGSFFVVPADGITFLNVFDVLEEDKISVALMVPSILSYLRPYFDEMNFQSLRYSLFCGEALKHSIVKEWKKCVPNAQIENLYGPTEATIFCSRYVWSENAKHRNDILSIGKPFSTTEFKIFPDGNSGELLIGGKQITKGYWKLPEKNKESFIKIDNERFYKTGDLVELKEDLYFYIGRKDFQVKIDGYRVELAEIENKLQQIFNAEVVCVATSRDNKTIIIAFIKAQRTQPTREQKQHINSKLVSYMRPNEYVFVESFPTNANGKTDRKQLLNLAIENRNK